MSNVIYIIEFINKENTREIKKLHITLDALSLISI